jgi:hypothetical protein
MKKAFVESQQNLYFRSLPMNLPIYPRYPKLVQLLSEDHNESLPFTSKYFTAPSFPIRCTHSPKLTFNSAKMDEGVAAMNAALLEAAASATPLQSTSDGDLTGGKRCSLQNCPLVGKGVIKYRCSNKGCNKTAHMACFTITVLCPNGKLDLLPDNLVAHCKK